jgi:hypothetical protein
MNCHLDAVFCHAPSLEPARVGPKVRPCHEKKGYAAPLPGTKVTFGFGQAFANMKHDCVIRDQNSNQRL